MPKIEVILADDHKIFREGIKALIASECNCSVIAEAANGQELLNVLEFKQPNLILLDINMPVMSGTEACLIIKEKYPTIKIIVLSMFSEIDFYRKMIAVGVNGFVLKSSGIDELSQAIAKVANGESYFSVDLLLNIINKDDNTSNELKIVDDTKITLTKNETIVLQLLCKGLSSEEIAASLCKSIPTIKGYKTNLFNKTDCKNSTSLVFYAIKHNLIKID